LEIEAPQLIDSRESLLLNCGLALGSRSCRWIHESRLSALVDGPHIRAKMMSNSDHGRCRLQPQTGQLIPVARPRTSRFLLTAYRGPPLPAGPARETIERNTGRLSRARDLTAVEEEAAAVEVGAALGRWLLSACQISAWLTSNIR